MNLRLNLLTFFVVGACGFGASAGELSIAIKANAQTVGKIQLSVRGDSATATVDEETERFDLQKMSWFDPKTNRWVGMEECRTWAEQSKAKSEKSGESAPAEMRPFMTWILNPSFRVEKSNQTLRLTSGQVDYVIEGEASRADVDAYYRYAVLNAYKKAMTEKKLPPFAELKAIEEMKALGYIPQKMSVSIPGIPRAPSFVIEIAETQ